MSASLLVELFTEELPPKALRQLGDSFGHRVQDWLIRAQLKTPVPHGTKVFATPRRLAVLIPDVQPKASDRPESKKLMPARVAFDVDRKPSEALTKRLKKEVASVNQLELKMEGDTEYVFLNQTIPGITLTAGLQIALQEAITKLPIPKLMSYQLADGVTTVQFVRPAHGLIALHGYEVIAISVLGLKAGRVTHGHRFLANSPITIKCADDYERALREEGKVEANFEVRRSRIREELKRAEEQLAREIGAQPNLRIPIDVERLVIDTEGADPAHLFAQTTNYDAVERALDCSGGTGLLDEVTALVEWPRAYWGHFDERFLDVPVECIALTMKHNQKYFPVFDASAKLLPYFVVISNNDDSLAKEQDKHQILTNIISGNERVLRPRLADARFFYDQDRKVRLEDRVPHLTQVVYHNRLGSQRDRVDRIKLIAGRIARDLGADSGSAERAAELCKADLLTAMVGEFPELQGVMGRYYALHDGEPKSVADAIEAHYRPRFAGARLPEGLVACAVALADKLELLVGMFGIGQQPTGDKDPYALRRSALGVIRILIERKLDIGILPLVDSAIGVMPEHARSDWLPIVEFILDRARSYFSERGYASTAIEAVLRPFGSVSWLHTLPEIVAEASRFIGTDEGKILAEANKRITNILKKSGYEVPFGFSPDQFKVTPNSNLFRDKAEIEFWDALQRVGVESLALKQQQRFAESLRVLSQLGMPTKSFFDDVMVNVEDIAIRDNRIVLLQHARAYMNQVADLSLMAS